MRRVTPEITEVRFGADEKLLAKMNRLRGLMAHRNPNFSTSKLINELCEIALDKLDFSRHEYKRSLPKTKALPNFIPPAPQVAPTAVSRQTLSRKYISVNTKREVWKNAQGKCQNCKSEYSLEIDHIRPLCLGGSSEEKNLQLLCRHCNQRAAIKFLGQNQVQKYLE